MNCNRYPNCNLKAVWEVVSALLEDALSRVTLEDLALGTPAAILEKLGTRQDDVKGRVLTTTIRKDGN